MAQSSNKIRKEVFSVIARIPRGKLLTYKRIGEIIHSKAYRTIGRIISSNRDYKNVPCHRVVMSDGRVGGYNRGVKNKILLLRKEGIEIINGKINGLRRHILT